MTFFYQNFKNAFFILFIFLGNFIGFSLQQDLETAVHNCEQSVGHKIEKLTLDDIKTCGLLDYALYQDIVTDTAKALNTGQPILQKIPNLDPMILPPTPATKQPITPLSSSTPPSPPPSEVPGVPAAKCRGKLRRRNDNYGTVDDPVFRENLVKQFNPNFFIRFWRNYFPDSVENVENIYLVD